MVKRSCELLRYTTHRIKCVERKTFFSQEELLIWQARWTEMIRGLDALEIGVNDLATMHSWLAKLHVGIYRTVSKESLLRINSGLRIIASFFSSLLSRVQRLGTNDDGEILGGSHLADDWQEVFSVLRELDYALDLLDVPEMKELVDCVRAYPNKVFAQEMLQCLRLVNGEVELRARCRIMMNENLEAARLTRTRLKLLCGQTYHPEIKLPELQRRAQDLLLHTQFSLAPPTSTDVDFWH